MYRTLYVLLLLTPYQLFAQVPDSIYKVNNLRSVFSILPTSDSGCIFGSSTKDSFLLRITRLSKNGEINKDKIFPQLGIALGSKIIRNSKGNLIVIGNIGYGKDYAFWLEINSTDFSLIQYKNYIGNCLDIIETDTTGYILAGTDGHYYCIQKINYQGDTVWTKKYYYQLTTNLNDGPKCTAIIKCLGGYILGGEKKLTDSGLIYKIDNKGNELWPSPIRTNYIGRKMSVLAADDNHFIFSDGKQISTSANESYLIKSDLNGNFEWQNQVNLANSSFMLDIHDLCFTHDGSILSAAGSQGMFFSKSTNIGHLIWSFTLYRDSVFYSAGVCETLDGNTMVGCGSLICKIGTNYPPFFVPSNSPIVDSVLTLSQYKHTFIAKDSFPNDKIKYQLISQDTSLKIDSLTGVFTWTPARTTVGLHSIKILALDRLFQSDYINLSLLVKPDSELIWDESKIKTVHLREGEDTVLSTIINPYLNSKVSVRNIIGIDTVDTSASFLYKTGYSSAGNVSLKTKVFLGNRSDSILWNIIISNTHLPPSIIYPINNSSIMISEFIKWSKCIDPDLNDSIKYKLQVTVNGTYYVKDNLIDTFFCLDNIGLLLDSIPIHSQISFRVTAYNSSYSTGYSNYITSILAQTGIYSAKKASIPNKFSILNIHRIQTSNNFSITIGIPKEMDNSNISAYVYTIAGRKITNLSDQKIKMGNLTMTIKSNDPIGVGLFIVKVQSGNKCLYSRINL